MTTTVSSTFRKKALFLMPQLRNRQDFCNLFGVLAFGTKSQDSKNPLVPRLTLAQCQKKEKELINHRYTDGKRFLKEFSKKVFPLTFRNFYITEHQSEEWLFAKGKCREVKPQYPGAVIALIQQERKRHWKNDKRVYLDTGQAVSSYQRILRQQAYDAFYSALLSKNNLPIANDLIKYLNRIPERLYSNLRKYIPVARKAIPSCGAADIEAQMDLLQAIDDNLRVKYVTANKSPRIYGLGQNITYLHRPIRKILTQDWIEVDIQSSQLCIAAHLWNLPELEEFLQNGGKIWDSLFQTFSMKYDPATKDIFKIALYATMYGGGRNIIMKKSLSKLGIKHPFATFMKNKWMKMLWTERKNQLFSIRQLGGAKDAFGRWIAIDKKKKVNAKSVLAQINQSWELQLLIPLIRHAIKNEDKGRFRIALWQHDGFSVWIRDKNRKDQLLSEMKAIFDKSAGELGFKTTLEYK